MQALTRAADPETMKMTTAVLLCVGLACVATAAAPPHPHPPAEVHGKYLSRYSDADPFGPNSAYETWVDDAKMRGRAENEYSTYLLVNDKTYFFQKPEKKCSCGTKAPGLKPSQMPMLGTLHPCASA